MAKRKNAINLLLAFVLVVTNLVLVNVILPNTVKAAEVTSYIDLDASGTAPHTISPATITTQPEVAASTADEFYISYTASATEFASSDTVTITVPSTFTSVGNCTSSTVDADLDNTTDGSMAASGNTLTYTFSAATTTANTNGVEFCFSATTPASNGNYSIPISDSNDSDNSATMIYVGTPAASADTNDVTVTATVPVVLALAIKDPTTTADTNSCALGILNPASLNTCSYRIAAGTNSTSGMRVEAVADGLLDSGGNDIDNVADGTVTTGAEEHGVSLTTGTGWTATSPFDAGDDPITTTQQEIQSASSAIDDSNTSTWTTVTHKASVTSATAPAGYDQVLTYRAYYMP